MPPSALKRALALALAGLCLAALGGAAPVTARLFSDRAPRTAQITVPSAGAWRCQVSVNGRVRAVFKNPSRRSTTFQLRFAPRPARAPASYSVAVRCPPEHAKRLSAPGPLASARMLAPPAKPKPTTPTPKPAPSAPGAISASAGNTTVTLSWAPATKSTDAVAGYDVYRDSTRVAQTSSSTYTDTGLSNGTPYSYYIRAYDAAGNLSAASARVSATPTLPALPAQGIFDSCPISTLLTQCITRVQSIAAAGLRIDVQPLPPYGSFVTPYLSALHAAGVRAMWEIDDPDWWGLNPDGSWGYDGQGADMLSDYPDWAAACDCQTNDQLLAFIVSTLSASGATWGWYVADDSQLNSPAYTNAQAISGIKAFSAELDALSPRTETLMSSWGDAFFTEYDAAYGAADITSQEEYPLMSQDASPASTADEAQQVGSSAATVQSAADQHGGPSSMILQAFSWGECSYDAAAAGVSSDARYPNADEMLAMRNAALLNAHPALLLWWNMFETIGWPTGQQPSACQAPTDPAARLAALSAAVTAPYPTPSSP